MNELELNCFYVYLYLIQKFYFHSVIQFKKNFWIVISPNQFARVFKRKLKFLFSEANKIVVLVLSKYQFMQK